MGQSGRGTKRNPLDRIRPAQAGNKKALLRRAAARLLANRDVGGVVLGEVSIQAGWSYGTAARTYASLHELLADLLIEHLVDLNAAICAAFDATLDAPPPVRLTAIADAFLRLALEQRDAHLTLRRNTALVQEAWREAVIGRSRQVIATLRTVLAGCVPGLETQPGLGKLLERQFAGQLSDVVTWFRPDDRVDTSGLAQLIAGQALMTARAIVLGEWSLPPPVTLPRLLPNTPESADPSDGARNVIWLTPEQARRSLNRLVRATVEGTEVVLTHRGWPAAKLVPATEEQARVRGIVGTTRTGVRSIRRAAEREVSGI